MEKKGGRGVSKKSTLVHPGGGGSEWPRGQKFEKKRYRRIMANDYEKSKLLHLLFRLEDAVHRRWLKTKACIFLCAKSYVIGDKVDIKLHYIELNWIFYGGVAFLPLLSTWTGGGVCRMSTLVHSRGGGGQNWVKIGPRSCWMPPNGKHFGKAMD